MGRRRKKSLKQKICEVTYRKKKFCRQIACFQNSMKEVCRILNPDADCRGRQERL